MTAIKSYKARYYKKIGNETVICYLCPRHCTITEGKRGFCFVRQNKGGEVVLTTYARGSGFCVDPIEKKPLYHFYPGSSVLSFGTAGCNLGCTFCQNWDLSRSKEMDRMNEYAPPQKIAQAAKRLNCTSVAFTYNDPVIFSEYAIDVADACHQHGIKTVAVTAGYIEEEARKDFFSRMDAANVDLKSFREEFYVRLTSSHLQPVLDTLKYLKTKTNVWFEITNLIIPDENDSKDEITEMCAWIKDNLGVAVPVHFSAFHPDYKLLQNPQTPHETLKNARTIALKTGLRYVYTGNVRSLEGSSTYCPKCKTCVIERNGYLLGAYNIKNGRCKFCNSEIDGHFKNAKGAWGHKRLPVHMENS